MKSLQYFSFFILLVLFELISLGYSKTVTVTDKNGTFKDDYEKLLSEKILQAGDKISFGNQDNFIYQSILGEGKTTRVFEVIDPKNNKTYALRIPFASEDFSTTESIRYLNHYNSGYDLLKNQGVPVPRIQKFKESQYILTEKKDLGFGLAKFLARPDLLSEKELRQAEEAFYIFIKKISPFKKIGDFHGEQIYFETNKKEWVLLDWVDSHKLAQNPTDDVAFEKILKSFQHEYDDDLRVIYKGHLGLKYKVPRPVTPRDKRILKKVMQITRNQRIVTVNENKAFFKAQKRRFKPNFSTRDYLNFYKKKPVPYIALYNQLLLDHFIKNKKHFLKRDIPFKEIIELKKHLTTNVQNPYDFIELALNKVNTMDQLEELLRTPKQSASYLKRKTFIPKLDKKITELLAITPLETLSIETLKGLKNNDLISQQYLGLISKEIMRKKSLPEYCNPPGLLGSLTSN